MLTNDTTSTTEPKKQRKIWLDEIEEKANTKKAEEKKPVVKKVEDKKPKKGTIKKTLTVAVPAAAGAIALPFVASALAMSAPVAGGLAGAVFGASFLAGRSKKAKK
ncbi:MAG: hypothetical protein ISR65_03385 [Bacteriovoracaceae bacterium]|nr:hypothetical protein [Bacteriovoracaceae bacterium]